MSQENVEVVRRWLEAAFGGAEGPLAVVAELSDDDIDYYPVRKFPGAHPCHGRDELLQWLGDYLEAFARIENAIRGLYPVGDDRVLAHVTLQMEGRTSGVGLEGDLYSSLWVRHGRLFRIEDHVRVSGALRALGLKDETIEAAGLSK